MPLLFLATFVMANDTPKVLFAFTGTDLQQIPNIGPSIAANLRLIGVLSPHDLLGKDPYKLYDGLCQTTGVRRDPCVIDVFIAAVRFMAGEPAKP